MTLRPFCTRTVSAATIQMTSVPIENGTRIVITAHFDNSPNNRYNPDPTKTIRWGEPSTEEMMDGWLEFILPAPATTQTTARR
jgi:hypothetical protein